MLHNLKIEYLKLRKYSTFWILSGLFIVSIFGINYITYTIIQSKTPKDPMSHALVGTPFQFPDVWQSVTYLSSFLLFIPGLLMIIFISNEFTFKTHRQNIIDGLSRTEFIGTKMIMAVIISLASTIVVFLTAYLFGLAVGGNPSFTGVKFVSYFFIQAISYIAVAMVIGMLLRRAGIAIGVYFLYITIFENMIGGILNKFTNNFGDFLPLNCTDSLIPLPFLKSITQKMIYTPNTTAPLIAAGIYLAVYYIFSRRQFETADL